MISCRIPAFIPSHAGMPFRSMRWAIGKKTTSAMNQVTAATFWLRRLVPGWCSLFFHFFPVFSLFMNPGPAK